MKIQSKPVSLGELAQRVGITCGPVSMADIANRVGYKKTPIGLDELADAVEKAYGKQDKKDKQEDQGKQ